MTSICRWLFLLYFLSTWAIITNSKEIRVVCYYTNWSVYRPGTAKFSPQNINPYLCTHLVYAFGGFTKENTLKPFDKYQDIEKGGYAKFTGLKTYNKNLKTLLAIGGWNEGSSRFSPMVANAERRKELVKNAIKFLRQNHFDGLDLDWEYPSFRDGGKPRDKDNYAQLVQELREEFERESEKTGRPRLLLTMAVPAGIEYINKGYDVPKLTKYLDWMNILSYDYHSAFEPAVNHHAPLYSLEEDSEYNYDVDLNIDHTIKHYLKLGAIPNKLVVGIPTYGRSYTLFNPDANDIGAPADGPGDMGEATRENGYLAYYEICDYVKSQGWEVVQPNPDAMGPYAFKENQWVGYDDPDIARKKAEYVVENDLGGIMFWSIDNDDFRGNCHGKPYPIIEAAKESLIQASGLTDDNLVAPKKPLKTKSRTRTRTTPKPTTITASTAAPVGRKKNRRRNRISIKSEESKLRKQETTKPTESYSSLKVVTPSYTTPEPPSTPDGGGTFKCEEEGFFPHPKDCKKYYWCLSGPGELGIIAHQFTCPAGLYFNKAADSCDYTQNVLCNKKLQKATSATTTTTTTTTAAPSTSSRAPSKLLAAARSRITTSTTPEPLQEDEDYEEYEDDEEEINEKHAEEDPKVIKELFDLIRKAGGIEELEKQLKIQESEGKSQTASNFNKNLVQKVLSTRKTLTNQRNTFSNKNSRGPQNEGLEQETESKEKSRPKYITIAREKGRSKPDENEEKEIEKGNDKKPSNKLEYVNIRRDRTSTTTEASNTGNINRNKLGEEIEEYDEEYEDEEPNTTRKAITTPQYVNIRRQRPSTTDGTTTPKYTVIRRGSTTEAPSSITEESSEKTSSTATTTSSQAGETKTRGTTTPKAFADENDVSKYKTIKRNITTTTESSPELRSTTLDDIISRLTTFVSSSSSSTIKNTASTPLPIIISSTERSIINLENTEAATLKTKPPLLFEPRPFSITTQTTSLKPIPETTTVRITKVSDTTNSIRTRRPSRFSFSTPLTTSSTTADNSQQQQRSRKRFTTTTESSLRSDESDLIRTFRPSEIADLSSLTAVDIGIVKDFNNRFGISRRRIVSTTPRTKINRKPTPNDLNDQIKSGSDVTTSVSSTEKPSFRNRKIIRRLRPTTTKPESTVVSRIRSTTENTKVNKVTSSSPLFRRRSRFTTPTTVENTKSVTVSPLQVKRFTKSTKPESINEQTKSTPKNDDLEDESDNETLDEINNEDEENIKLSESNIRENNDVNNNNRISSEDGKKIRTKVLKRVKNPGATDENTPEEDRLPRIKFSFKDRVVLNEKSTEPNIIVRTRKFIRKLTTQSTTPTSTTTESLDVTSGKKRKIIRRIRPTTATKINNFDDDKETDKLKQANKLISRPRFTTPTPGVEELGSPIIEEEFAKDKTINLQSVKINNTTTEKDENSTLKIYLQKSNTTESESIKDSDENEDSNEIITENNEEADLTTIIPTTTTTQKSTTPYVNRLLQKQKNRPTYVRPKLTTPSPSSTTTSRSRFRSNRVTSPKPTEENKKEENRFSRRFTTSRTTSKRSSIGISIPSTTTTPTTTLFPFNFLFANNTTTESTTIVFGTSTLATPTSTILTTSESDVTKQATTSTTLDNDIIEKTTTEILTKTQSNTENIESTISPVAEETTTEKNFYDTTLIQNEITTEGIAKTEPSVNSVKEVTEEVETTMLDLLTSTFSNWVVTESTENNLLNLSTPTTETLEDSTPGGLKTTTIENNEEIKSSTQPEEFISSTPRSRFILRARTTGNPVKDETTTELQEPSKEKSTTSRNIRLSYRERNLQKLKAIESPEQKTETKPTPRRRFNYRGRTTEKSVDNEKKTEEVKAEESVVPVSKNRFILRNKEKATVPIIKNRFNLKNKDEENPETQLDEFKDVVAEEEKSKSKDIFKQQSPRPSLQNRKNKAITEAPKEEVNSEVLKARNKDLFSTNKRKMNTPFTGLRPEISTKSLNPMDETTVENEANIATSSPQETTEYLSTLYHIFAEVESDMETTTPSLTIMNKSESKVERLIEVSRITEVHNNEDSKEKKLFDKIGAISRITSIKIVDPKENEIGNTTKYDLLESATVRDISGNRKDRKYEIYGNSKVSNSKTGPPLEKAEIIDGLSHINVITPRPYFSTEAATIALEGLFQTTPKTIYDLNQHQTQDEELLETDNSKFVSVRILDQNGGRNFGIKDNTKILPIKVLPQDEYITMKAHVVEVTPNVKEEKIKIVPIKVEMSRKLIN